MSEHRSAAEGGAPEGAAEHRSGAEGGAPEGAAEHRSGAEGGAQHRADPPRLRRDRRGRGLRGPLVPAGVPLHRSRAEQFDDLVLGAVEHLDERWAKDLENVEFAVEDVPAVPLPTPGDGLPALADVDVDAVSDAGVPLGRLQPAGRDSAGHRTPARVVVYRRPLEARSIDRSDLADLVLEVVIEQVARLLGVDPDELDPPTP